MQRFIGSLCTWIERRLWCLQPKKRERKKKKRKRLLSFAFSSAIKFRYLDSYRKLSKSSLGIPCPHQWHALFGSPVARTVINKGHVWLSVFGFIFFACATVMQSLSFQGMMSVILNICFFKGHNNQEKQILIFFCFYAPEAAVFTYFKPCLPMLESLDGVRRKNLIP